MAVPRHNARGHAGALLFCGAILAGGCARDDDDRTGKPGSPSWATVLNAPSPKVVAASGHVPANMESAADDAAVTVAQAQARNAVLAKLDRFGVSAGPAGRGIRIGSPRNADKAEFLADLAAEAANVPVTFMPEYDLPALSPELTRRVKLFPQQPRRASIEQSLDEAGRIVLRDGCIYARRSDGSEALAVFPGDLGLFTDAEGFIAFRFRYSGIVRHLPQIGSQARLGHVESIAPPRELVANCGNHPTVSVSAVSVDQTQARQRD